MLILAERHGRGVLLSRDLGVLQRVQAFLEQDGVPVRFARRVGGGKGGKEEERSAQRRWLMSGLGKKHNDRRLACVSYYGDTCSSYNTSGAFLSSGRLFSGITSTRKNIITVRGKSLSLRSARASKVSS